MGALTRLTDEQFLNLPDAPGKQELLHGDLLVLPPAKHAHNRIARRFYERLLLSLPASRVWLESGYRLASGYWLQPDVSITWPDQPVDEWFVGSPMVAIEIASAGNTAEELRRKVEAYLRHGSDEIWMVYPDTTAMTVFSEGREFEVKDVYTYSSPLRVPVIDVDVRELIVGA